MKKFTITQAQWLSSKTKNSATPQVIMVPKYFYEHKNMEQEMSLKTALSWDKGQFLEDATQGET